MLEGLSLCLLFTLIHLLVSLCLPPHASSTHPSVYLSICQWVQGQLHPGPAGSGQTGRLQGWWPHYGRGELRRIKFLVPMHIFLLNDLFWVFFLTCCLVFLLQNVYLKITQWNYTFLRMYFKLIICLTLYMYVYPIAPLIPVSVCLSPCRVQIRLAHSWSSWTGRLTPSLLSCMSLPSRLWATTCCPSKTTSTSAKNTNDKMRKLLTLRGLCFCFN